MSFSIGSNIVHQKKGKEVRFASPPKINAGLQKTKDHKVADTASDEVMRTDVPCDERGCQKSC